MNLTELFTDQTSTPPVMEDREARAYRWQAQANTTYQRKRRFGKSIFRRTSMLVPKYIGEEQLQPDNPDNPTTSIFLFWCKQCREPRIDYPHGYSQRLDCRVCKQRESDSVKS